MVFVVTALVLGERSRSGRLRSNHSRTGALVLHGSSLKSQSVLIPSRESGYPKDSLEDWERELLDGLTQRSSWAKLDLDEDGATDKFDGFRVQRLEFTPVRSTRNQFFA